ncbi:MAG TPA: alpha/beta fold hydrolase [Bryobacteraceae bacterium]|nr:alpha/beta fold hydrolase [Bryobacteraceae bacterium]
MIGRFGWMLCALTAFHAFAPAADRRHDLDNLLKILPPTSSKMSGRINAQDRTWEDWLRRTGELPPDFDLMPSQPMLPDPLHHAATPALWAKRKTWIHQQYEKWVIGAMPPAPGNVRGTVTSDRSEGSVRVREVRLEFGPGHRATLRLQIITPPGNGPFPVFLTNHLRMRPWVNTAVRRGYAACIYQALDPIYGAEDDSDKWIEVYPDYDWSTIARWAWAGMRAVDYLVTLPEIDKARIGITGHSRNGKQALLAAAFDDRIAAVVASSGNTGECTPWRYTTDPFANESIEQITGSFPHWFHPRLRFFAGREHKLPVDQNLLMAMVAPRGLLMASAYSEAQGASFGFEQAYRSVRSVYQMLGKPQNLGLSLRAGEHATTAGDIERYVDFFDTVFGRKAFPPEETWMHGYTFAGWQALSGERSAHPPKGDLRERLRWALGDEPPAVPFPLVKTLGRSARTSEGWLADLYRRPLTIEGARAAALSFGDDLKGDLYVPANGPGPWPAVVWLHAYSYPTGYSRYAKAPFEALIRRGFAVLAFDQIGFGSRIEHAREFYRRYPRWTLGGKMVADTRAAVEALAALDAIDSKRIAVVGYSLGAKIGLITAALDDRIAAAVAIAGVESLRNPSPETEGLRHYSHLHGLMPRFGFYLENPSALPVDYDEILAAAAPRPVLVVAPELDRYAPLDAVRALVTSAREQNPAVDLETPLDFNRLSRSTQERAFNWLAGKLGL